MMVNLLNRAFRVSSLLQNKYYRDFIWFAIGFFITSFIALFTSILVNRNLDQENLGKFTYYKSLLELLTYVFTLVLYRSYLRFNAKNVSMYVVRIVKAFSLFAVFILLFVSYFLTGSIFSILFAFFVYYEERLYFFRSIMATVKLNILRIGASLVTLITVLCITFFYTLSSDLVLFAYGLGFLITLFLMKSDFTSTEPEGHEDVSLKKLLVFSLPALGSMLIKVFQDFGAQFFIKSVFSFEQVSTFSIALRVLLSVKLFSSLLMMYYPSIYFKEIQKKNAKVISNIRMYMSVVIMMVCLFAIVFANELYVLMGARDYLDYVLYFQILVFSEFLYTTGGFFGTYLAHILKTHLTMLVFSISAVINLVILILFLKTYGVVIAALGIMVSNVFMFCFHMCYTRRLENEFLRKEEVSL
jgi:O-antigen/teichoic acid export membrane protein